MFSIPQQLEVVNNIRVSRKTDRTVYAYKGIRICHDLTYGGLLTPPKDSCYIAISLTPEQVLELGAKVSWASYYCQDGLFFPEFRGEDCLEKMKVLIDKYTDSAK